MVLARVASAPDAAEGSGELEANCGASSGPSEVTE